MGNAGIFKSKESSHLFSQASIALSNDRPIDECKALADRFLEVEGEVPQATTVLIELVNIYYEYGIKYQDKASLKKAIKYASLGYNLAIEKEHERLWYFEKYLGLSMFHGGSIGIKEAEKIEYLLGKSYQSDASDSSVHFALTMVSKMKAELMKSELRNSNSPAPTKKQEKKGFFSKLFGG